MKSGIYALYWWNVDLVYVGLSQNLFSRKKEHYSLLANNKHTNYKVQQAYIEYGVPDFIVLEYCPISQLQEKEIYWCHELDALGVQGLCIVEPGIVGFGSNSNASKYSKFQILKSFSLLYKGSMPYSEISTITKVSKATLFDIVHGNSHLWLKDTYPQQYKAMQQVDRWEVFTKNTKPRAIVQNKEGQQFEIGVVAEFCEQYFGSRNDKKHMASVLTGGRKSHKGFTLVKLL